MPFSGTFSGLQALQARVRDAQVLIGPLVARGINSAAQDAVQLVHDACPVDTDEDNVQIPGEEGHLADSFFADPVQETSVGATTTVRTREPIKFSYVTLGTLDKEPITPRTKLALWWPSAPHPLASVHGQKANDFASPVADVVANRGYQYFQPFLDALGQAL